MDSPNPSFEAPAGEVRTDEGNHFSCSMSSVLIDHIRVELGEDAVERLLIEAGSPRTLEYLEDLANWISFDEAIALFRAGALLTGDERFAFNVGIEAARRLAGSAVAALVRSLGSTEEAYRQLNVTATKFNTVTAQEVLEVKPGYALLKVGARAGFPRSAAHCQHTQGLFSCTPMLFGLAPAKVEHEDCAGEGKADACIYRITWDVTKPADLSQGDAQSAALKLQLDAMTVRLQSMFATAADLIASNDLDMTLARITDRAALEVRAPKYLLAVRPTPEDDLLIHFKGCTEEQAQAAANRALTEDARSLPPSWLVARVGSHRHNYGCIVAMHDAGDRFMVQEHELLEVYARYAATALDSATALLEAQRRHAEANALLGLARSLASASTSGEIASRVCETVPFVVDCDRVDFLIRGAADGRLETAAVADKRTAAGLSPHAIRSEITENLAGHFADPHAPTLFIDEESDDPTNLRLLLDLVARSAAIVPIRAHGQFLGALIVSAQSRPQRLAESASLADLLTGVAAHATGALENVMLIDRITYQALHDGLTGLANRASFSKRLAAAADGADNTAVPFSLFYLDLDLFKLINDEFGHGIGDELLREVAARLTACVRSDDTVARLGGDEFAVIVEGTDSQTVAAAVERRFADAFAKPFELSGHRLDVGVSIGRANWREHADEIDALVRHADAQMYDIKRRHHEALPSSR